MIDRKWLKRVIDEAKRSDVLQPRSERANADPAPFVLRDIKPAIRLVSIDG